MNDVLSIDLIRLTQCFQFFIRQENLKNQIKIRPFFSKLADQNRTNFQQFSRNIRPSQKKSDQVKKNRTKIGLKFGLEIITICYIACVYFTVFLIDVFIPHNGLFIFYMKKCVSLILTCDVTYDFERTIPKQSKFSPNYTHISIK